MKYRIIIIFTILIASTCAYSQHIEDAIPVDIPINSTKESAIQKLLNRGYWLYSTSEEDGYKILEYKKDKKVKLWTKGNIIPIVSWELYFPSGVELLFNGAEGEGVEMELEKVYGIEPYQWTTKTKYNGMTADFEKYYHWKGNTIILSTHELFILSNADAEKRYQRDIKEKEKMEREQKEKERLEQERKVRELQEQRRREQEQLERTRKAEAKRKREADSIAHINELISNYSSCRFLFENEKDYVACVTGKQQPKIESEIKQLISKEMSEISRSVKNGKELQIDKNGSGAELLRVCNICQKNGSISLVNYDKYIKALADYTESQLESFVANRKTLNKAYIRAQKQDPNIKYSEFLISYINDNKSRTEVTSNRIFAMANLAYSNAPQYSFGLTIGAAKTFGWYVGLNSDLISIFNNNFKYDIADYECDHLGTINELASEYSFSGNKSTSRLGVVAGMVFNLIGPMYAYAGGGYGLRNAFWELENGKWAKCTDDSSQGVAFDAGLMLSSGNYGLSFGIQTIGVKYVEAKIGIGISF